jgi:site-specific DNA-methyltransferase (adenine-specific)
VLPTLAAGSVDHTFTDTPYSERTHEGAKTAARKKVNYKTKQMGNLVEFKCITEEYLHTVLSEVGRLTGRWVLFFTDWLFMNGLYHTPPADLDFIRHGVWIKPNGAPQFTGDRPGMGWEAVAILHKRGKKKQWNSGGHHATWIHNIAHQNSYPGNNGTTKPLNLIEQMIIQFTNEGDTILDPFMGSGTTGHAAINTNRKFIGIEKDKNQFIVAAERIANAAGDYTTTEAERAKGQLALWDM